MEEWSRPTSTSHAELAYLKGCSHPNIVAFVQAFKADTQITLVTEYLDGELLGVCVWLVVCGVLLRVCSFLCVECVGCHVLCPMLQVLLARSLTLCRRRSE